MEWGAERQRQDHRQPNSPTHYIKNLSKDFLSSAVDMNPPTNVGNTGSAPGPGRSHMQQSN